MDRYAVNERTISDAVTRGGLLVVAQWEAKEGEADRIADILARFLPEAQREEGAQLFLISRAKENPAQFLFYELFRDEAAFKAHQESEHFKTYIAGQALPLLARRERMQYALILEEHLPSAFVAYPSPHPPPQGGREPDWRAHLTSHCGECTQSCKRSAVMDAPADGFPPPLRGRVRERGGPHGQC